MMRWFALFFGCLALLGCREAAPLAELPSDQVLRRAAFASRRLTSAAFRLTGTMASERGPLSGLSAVTLGLTGILEPRSEAVSASGSATLTTRRAGRDNRLSVRGELTMVRSQLSFSLGSVAAHPDPSGQLEQIFTPLLGRWWRLPDSAESDQAERVTPDSQFLEAQASVVRVTKDLGRAEEFGRLQYRYEVVIDSDRLRRFLQLTDSGGAGIDSVSANGELWIDAESFYLTRARWHVTNVPLDQIRAVVDVDIRLQEHDRAVHVAPPERTEVFPFPLTSGYTTFSSGSLLPELPEEVDTGPQS